MRKLNQFSYLSRKALLVLPVALGCSDGFADGSNSFEEAPTLNPPFSAEEEQTSSGAPSPGTQGSSSLSLLRIPENASRNTLARLHLWSEAMPWKDAEGSEVWVMKLSSGLRTALENDGIQIEPFAYPPEFAHWPADRQEAFSLVAEECFHQSGASPITNPHERARTTFTRQDGLHSEVFAPLGGDNYGAYYLPGNIIDDPNNPQMPIAGNIYQRLNHWKASATGQGFAVRSAQGQPGIAVPISPEMLDVSTDGAFIDSESEHIPFIRIGWQSKGSWRGREHEGPKAALFLIANQHPREIVTYESAWRLAQRIVAYYALADSSAATQGASFPKDEGGRSLGHWRDLIDRGLHIVIIPTANLPVYNSVINDQWPESPLSSWLWARTNKKFVDLNRNHSTHWLQGGNDSSEKWGVGANLTADSRAGRHPGSENETQAIDGIIRRTLTLIGANADSRDAFNRRLPAIAIDLHSAFGTVLRASYVSSELTPAQGLGQSAWLCSAASDCLHPDAAAMVGLFGTNERPGIVGTTGLVESPDNNPAIEDPPTPYTHGNAAYNIYPTSGDLVQSLADWKWKPNILFGNYKNNAIPSATIEVTAYNGNNPFGFGTCAPKEKASEAIDEVVENLLPLFSHLASSAFDPANPPASNTQLINRNRVDRANIKMPRIRDVMDFGIRAEARAQHKNWISQTDCNFPSDILCFSGDCGQLPGDLCRGPWWTAYTLGDSVSPRAGLARYWAFSVRQPDPKSLLPREQYGKQARLNLKACSPAYACPSLGPLPLVRRGSLFDLYSIYSRVIALPSTRVFPSRVTLQREVLQGDGRWLEDGVEWHYVARPLANQPDWPPQAPATQIGLELSQLIQPGERLRAVRLSYASPKNEIDSVRIAASWPTSAGLKNKEINLVFPSGANQRWSGTGNWAHSWHHWYNYEAELLHPVEDTPGGVSTDGENVWVAFSAANPPTLPMLTAELAGSGSRCALSEITNSAVALAALRWVRDELLARDELGRKYTYAYEQLSGELIELIQEYPALKAALLEFLAYILAKAQGEERGQLAQAMLGVSGLRAVQILKTHGSQELQLSLEEGLKHLPELLARMDWQKLEKPEIQNLLAGAKHALD